MSKENAVVVASRTLGLLLIVWTMAEVANLPAYLQSYLYYLRHAVSSSSSPEYWQFWSRHYAIDASFCVTKIVGFSLLARWLFKGGPEVAELLLPSAEEPMPSAPAGDLTR